MCEYFHHVTRHATGYYIHRPSDSEPLCHKQHQSRTRIDGRPRSLSHALIDFPKPRRHVHRAHAPIAVQVDAHQQVAPLWLAPALLALRGQQLLQCGRELRRLAWRKGVERRLARGEGGGEAPERCGGRRPLLQGVRGGGGGQAEEEEEEAGRGGGGGEEGGEEEEERAPSERERERGVGGERRKRQLFEGGGGVVMSADEGWGEGVGSR